MTGAFSLANFANPVWFVCGLIGAVENTTAPETAKLCAQYLGPALRLLNFNYLPFPINPYLRPVPSPEYMSTPTRSSHPAAQGPATRPNRRQRCRRTPAWAMSCRPRPGLGSRHPDRQGLYGQGEVPAIPSPALFPGAPIPGPPTIIPGPSQTPTVDGMLLPQTAAPAAPPPPPGPPLPAEAGAPS